MCFQKNHEVFVLIYRREVINVDNVRQGLGLCLTFIAVLLHLLSRVWAHIL